MPRAPRVPGYHVTQHPSTIPGLQQPPINPPGSSDPTTISRNQVFPYKINIDAISYMGCPDPAANDPIFTSFKLGSYNKGLQLTDEFKKSVNRYTPSQKRTVLRDSPLINSRGQVTISHRGSIQQTIKIQNQPLINFFPSINNPEVLEELAKNNAVFDLGINNPLEVILPIPGNILQNIISYLTSNYHITLTYNNGSSPPQPLGPGQNQYYGRSYQVSFDRSLSYMEDIEEYDLLTRKKVSGWSCPDQAKLIILRHEQISERDYLQGKRYFDYYNIPREAVCIEDRQALSQVGKKTVENLLPENLFSVGFVHTWKKDEDEEEDTLTLEKTDVPCLTTQTAHWSCYSNSSTVRVEWNERDCKVNDLYARCAAYFSFCTKR